ncbi:hypothetical protein DES40_1686 [Litorimonas taeanensis]|uniref:Uncharacterized protein n=1 Tax=Litorimonas taeanensis TaxID=568099 RepID=A0A420WD21_9PROT|nr:hypothetical protein [Litorimonas taeanensis]RKQ68911.1 hypothetical protein DES40_1686 [Litorimonas taeanensis]
MTREGLLTFKLFKQGVPDNDLTPSPIHDGAEFISGALRAVENTTQKIRESVQSDMADTLNCKRDALSFMWAERVQGAATLDCEIPDFRAALNDRENTAFAAE